MRKRLSGTELRWALPLQICAITRATVLLVRDIHATCSFYAWKCYEHTNCFPLTCQHH